MDSFQDSFILGRRTSIDKTTKQFYQTRRYDGKRLSLVMSDEFNSDNRRFQMGEDRFLHGIEKSDTTNQSIQYYSSDETHVTTKNGSLVLTVTAEKNENHPYTSAMVQSWNQFCFTGGVFEVSVQFSAGSTSSGLWPAVWLMGNLGRATFWRSTENMWPWSYNRCKANETQGKKQRIKACDATSIREGLLPHQGRGAPEIDILEIRQNRRRNTSPRFVPGQDNGFLTASMQLAPGIEKHIHPKNGAPLNSALHKWYDVKLGEGAWYNEDYWGYEMEEFSETPYMVDSVSAKQILDDSYFESFHKFTLEWQPPSVSTGHAGYISWYHDGKLLLHIEGASIEQLTGAQIPAEPMYMILNIAMSQDWGLTRDYALDEDVNGETLPLSEREKCEYIRGTTRPCFDCHREECACWLPPKLRHNCSSFKEEFKVDYIRLFQDLEAPSHTVSCSPPNYPTASYINTHIDMYTEGQAIPPNEDRQTRNAASNFVFSVQNKVGASVAILLAAILGVLLWNMNKRCSSRNNYQRISDADDAGLNMASVA